MRHPKQQALRTARPVLVEFVSAKVGGQLLVRAGTVHNGASGRYCIIPKEPAGFWGGCKSPGKLGTNLGQSR